MTRDEALRAARDYLRGTESEGLLAEADARFVPPPAEVYGGGVAPRWVVPLHPAAEGRYVGATRAVLVCPDGGRVARAKYGE